jgi:hypothetical protein
MQRLLKSTSSETLLKLSLLAWIIYKIFTINLWFSVNRNFPIVNPIDEIYLTNNVISDLISGLIFLLLLISVFRIKQWILILLFILEFLLCSSDMMRWQPPVFQYLITLAVYILKPKEFKYYLILILSATYFFAGLNKLNLKFINMGWSIVLLKNYFGIPAEIAFNKFVKAVGFIIPITEMLAGLLLLSRFYKYGFYIAIMFHIFILICISPIGFEFSPAIMSWNLLLLFYCFYFLYTQSRLVLKKSLFLAFFTLLIYGLPFLNLIDKYYPYFSFDLVSGTKYYLHLKISNPNAVTSSDSLKKYIDTKTSEIDVNDWCFENLNVPFTHNYFLFDRLISKFEKENSKLIFTAETLPYPYKTHVLYYPLAD